MSIRAKTTYSPGILAQKVMLLKWNVPGINLQNWSQGKQRNQNTSIVNFVWDIFYSLQLCYSECQPQTSSITILWYLIRNVESQTHSRTTESNLYFNKIPKWLIHLQIFYDFTYMRFLEHLISKKHKGEWWLTWATGWEKWRVIV